MANPIVLHIYLILINLILFICTVYFIARLNCTPTSNVPSDSSLTTLMVFLLESISL